MFLLIALFLMSAPPLCVQYTPGYRLLTRLIPSFDPQTFRFYPAIVSVTLVSLPVQYLGRVS
ncbi:hypothetical protein ASPZODRAFT_135284 [Penicilliopsis zonata CBS 506.65]|uniref:Uncharacterized protein n=1 Tax=Penicilliopsis zonata CBS 506.65 TaxID=1073090 RepID=A0A1L9SBG8_9EURO|nr:hypothetical protein ASPZODRAFT_135284 [Penicilliopsis zonata CBS 506.65]OJJ44459.1 hypothetical protein ASPZODRAFT_135284 [Penicilliopsis zonata CBS 506.65]